MNGEFWSSTCHPSHCKHVHVHPHFAWTCMFPRSNPSNVSMIMPCFKQAHLRYIDTKPFGKHGTQHTAKCCDGSGSMLGAGSQVRYMASSPSPLLVQGHAPDTAASGQPTPASHSVDTEQGDTAHATDQVRMASMHCKAMHA